MVQFVKNKPFCSLPTHANSNLIKKVSPPIPPHPTKEQLEKSKKHYAKRNHKDTPKPSLTKLFAQVMASVTNILKIKEAFPALPNKKIIEIHDTALAQPTNKEIGEGGKEANRRRVDQGREEQL